MDIASTMRVPTARFVEWQHPDVKAVLRAEAHRGRVVATQAQILLASLSVRAPDLAFRRRDGVGLCRFQWCDRHSRRAKRCARAV